LGSSTRVGSLSAGDTLTLSGTTSAAASTSYLLTFGGAGNTTVTGAINTVDGGIRKEGTGTLTLARDNGYAGATDVTAGTLVVRNDGALGNFAGGTTVSNNAELQLSKLSTDLSIGNESLTINGTGYNGGNTGALHNVSGNNTYQGGVQLGTIGATIKADG